MTTATATDTARSLDAAAMWLRTHGADLPFLPYITCGHRGIVEMAFQVDNVEGDDEQKAATALLVRLIGGHWRKETYSDDRLYLDQTDDDRIHFSISVDRQAVCERVVTGTREVVVPAVEAAPARFETIEDFEWVCAPILTGGAA